MYCKTEAVGAQRCVEICLHSIHDQWMDKTVECLHYRWLPLLCHYIQCTGTSTHCIGSTYGVLSGEREGLCGDWGIKSWGFFINHRLPAKLKEETFYFTRDIKKQWIAYVNCEVHMSSVHNILLSLSLGLISCGSDNQTRVYYLFSQIMRQEAEENETVNHMNFLYSPFCVVLSVSRSQPVFVHYKLYTTRWHVSLFASSSVFNINNKVVNLWHPPVDR